MWNWERILDGAFSHIERLPHNPPVKKGKGSPYSITECRVPKLIPVLCSRPAGDVSHKPVGGLSLLSTRPTVTPATFKRAATNFSSWWTEAQWVWTVCRFRCLNVLLPPSVIFGWQTFAAYTRVARLVPLLLNIARVSDRAEFQILMLKVIRHFIVVACWTAFFIRRDDYYYHFPIPIIIGP